VDLTQRQKKILQAVVDCYVSTAEPVGSKTIAAMPDMNYSSATIRNELATLTEQGLLEQPHTSAGRVPSPSGYRFYIDELMQSYRLSRDETQSLNQAMTGKLQEFDQAIAQVGQLISKLTNLPAYAVATKSRTVTASRFELIQTGAHSFILVLLLSTEAVHNKLIKLPVNVDPQDLKSLTAMLNTTLTDLSPQDITPQLLAKLQRNAGSAASLVSVVVEYTVQTLSEEQKNDVYVTGQTRLLGQPEYQDIGKATELITHLDEDVIATLPVPQADSDSKVTFLVGPENVSQALKETSVVMARYDLGDGMQGMLGVVGPTRMDYAQVAARLSYFAEGLGKMFSKALPPSPPESPEPQKQED
jgi:heat-inducible transcriptional repressor